MNILSEQALLPVQDRGTAYGDGFFTTIWVQRGQMLLWPLHLQRLSDCGRRLGFPAFDLQQLQIYCEQKIAGVERACLKIMVTRGQGGRGYSPTGCLEPTIVVQFHPYPQHYQQWREAGIRLGVCQQQLGCQPMLAGLKTLNRLEQVLLKQEMEQHHWQEAVVLDWQGFVVEGVTGNLFWRKDDQVFTPDLQQAGVCGVMRSFVMQALQDSQPVQVVRAPLEALLEADEVWITNALMGVVPVTGIQDVDYKCHRWARFCQSAFSAQT